MKRKNRIIIVIITVTLVIISLLITFMLKKEDNNPTISDTKGMDKADEEIDVDKLIYNLINSDTYSKMSYNEKKEACKKLLDELKSKEVITFYDYSEITGLYSFEYKDGTLGGIQIKEWDPYMN